MLTIITLTAGCFGRYCSGGSFLFFRSIIRLSPFQSVIISKRTRSRAGKWTHCQMKALERLKHVKTTSSAFLFGSATGLRFDALLDEACSARICLDNSFSSLLLFFLFDTERVIFSLVACQRTGRWTAFRGAISRC